MENLHPSQDLLYTLWKKIIEKKMGNIRKALLQLFVETWQNKDVLLSQKG